MRSKRLWQTFVYFGQEAWTGFRRNGMMSIAAVMTGMVTLLILGASILVQANLGHLTGILESQVEVVAYLQDGLRAKELASLQKRAAAIPHVREVRFVSKEVALERLQEAFAERVILRDLLDTNPLPDSLEVRVHDPARIREVARALKQLPGVEEVTHGRQAIDRLLALTGAVRLASALAVIVLTGVALVIIVNTIRLTILARRQEIEIMKLVGATSWFIRWPFLLEGFIQGVLAAAPAVVFLALSYFISANRLRTLMPFLPVVTPSSILPTLTLTIMAAGTVMGVGGSLFSLHRFLNPREPTAKDPLRRRRRRFTIISRRFRTR